MKQCLNLLLTNSWLKPITAFKTRMLVLSLLFFVNTSMADNSAHQTLVGLASATEIYYVDPITPKGTDKFEVLFSKHQADLNTLIINSTGGEVFAGLRLGNLVREHQLKVRVQENCSSACANYVLPASSSVFVEARAIIGWHGGSLQSLYEPFPFEQAMGASPTQAQKKHACRICEKLARG